ncbi:MAG: DUF1289 domain-containing protein [Burkholderiales bacterium]|nr:DUF1289 domain-containing protein [Burkholderiales bacterium]
MAARAAAICASGQFDVESPCVSICQLDAAGALCVGCLRTLDEIAAWSSMDSPAKRAVWVRLATLGL